MPEIMESLYLAMRASARAAWTTIKNGIEGIDAEVKAMKTQNEAETAAAHGGNRTGRIFTGYSSGGFLYRSLYRAGFANQPTSTDRGDGLRLTDCYITAGIRCAPPDNKPTPTELSRCRSFLLEELTLLRQLRVVAALGPIAFRASPP